MFISKSYTYYIMIQKLFTMNIFTTTKLYQLDIKTDLNLLFEIKYF